MRILPLIGAICIVIGIVAIVAAIVPGWAFFGGFIRDLALGIVLCLVGTALGGKDVLR